MFYEILQCDPLTKLSCNGGFAISQLPNFVPGFSAALNDISIFNYSASYQLVGLAR